MDARPGLHGDQAAVDLAFADALKEHAPHLDFEKFKVMVAGEVPGTNPFGHRSADSSQHRVPLHGTLAPTDAIWWMLDTPPDNWEFTGETMECDGILHRAIRPIFDIRDLTE
jgi:hypothetical protein